MRKCGPQIWLCLCFDPLRWYICNGLTSINTFRCIWDLKVTHRTAVWDVPGSSKGFMFAFLFCLVVDVVVFLLYVHNIIFMKFCNSFCDVHSFSILNKLQNVWPIIRISRYRPSIRNIFIFTKRNHLRCVYWQI